MSVLTRLCHLQISTALDDRRTHTRYMFQLTCASSDSFFFQTGLFSRGLSGYRFSLRTGLPELYWIHYKTMKKQTATETRE